MHIIQAGYFRSGNFWLYQIINQLLESANIKHSSFIQNHPISKIAKNWELSFKGQSSIDMLDILDYGIFYRISSIFRHPVENVDDYINQCSQVWTHSDFCSKSTEFLAKFDKIVYIIRDPRDVLVSWSKYLFIPNSKKYISRLSYGENSPESYLQNKLNFVISQWENNVNGYLKYKDELNIYVVFYERLLGDFEEELKKMSQYLGLKINDESISTIKQSVEFEKLKKDNPQHVRKGTSGQWVDILSESQKAEVLQIIEPTLKRLNYPLDENLNNLPSLRVA